MTPAEHYAEAEGLLVAIDDLQEDVALRVAPLLLAEAQVHATLAAVHPDVLAERDLVVDLTQPSGRDGGS